MDESKDQERKEPGEGTSEDRIADAKKALERCKQVEKHNRDTFLEDVRFALLGEQWEASVLNTRLDQRRPCLVINRMAATIKQVVNDSRQNKPAVKVKGVDNFADPQTADVLGGLIRNIESVSNADVAYDTAVQNAVAGGFGYIRVSMDYAFNDAFDMDLMIERVMDPLTVYGDPNSTSVDGSDWDECFVAERMTRREFKKKYGEDKDVNTELDGIEWESVDGDWLNEDGVLVTEWWQRKEVTELAYKLSDGTIVTEEQIENDEDIKLALSTMQVTVVAKKEIKSHKITQTMLTGVDILETNDWPGKYIPIVPVYGEEFSVGGKRYFRSLINSAKDAQRQLNFWRSTATELAGMAPRVPWIGPKGTFDSDADKWATANTGNHAYLEYDEAPPTRQPLDSGVAAGSMQEAMIATDDIKAITGIYDASLGARSNETSGRAIMARQREGDNSTFHFIDNLSRSIRQIGRILIDLIPHVYSAERVIRVLGEDGKEDHVTINGPTPAKDDDGNEMRDEMGNVVMRMHDLSRGKYDISVDTGPSFTTRREEAAAQMTELVRAFPQAAPVIADLMAKNMDWPQADEVAKRFEKMNPMAQKDAIPPQLKQQMQQGMEMIKQLKAENDQLKTDNRVKSAEAQADMAKAKADMAEAQADLMEAQAKIMELQQARALQQPMVPMPQ